ncbi:MAG: TRAP transporter large permease subunit, partial [Planctomycetota bacterium]|nr:TRAP transporter large permease subunit [Planctomycetota bacterium]
RTLTWKEFWNCCSRTAKTTANVLFIIAVASSMGWAITTLQVPQQIVAFCMEYIHSPALFLIFVNILLLIVGMILDQSPALLIMVPILLPVAQAYDIDPLHFGLLICINLTVGLITPPVGMTLFVTSNVGKIKLNDMYKQILPFVVVCVTMLVLVTFIPQLTLAIPGWIV